MIECRALLVIVRDKWSKVGRDFKERSAADEHSFNSPDSRVGRHPSEYGDVRDLQLTGVCPPMGESDGNLRVKLKGVAALSSTTIPGLEGRCTFVVLKLTSEW